MYSQAKRERRGKGNAAAAQGLKSAIVRNPTVEKGPGKENVRQGTGNHECSCEFQFLQVPGRRCRAVPGPGSPGKVPSTICRAIPAGVGGPGKAAKGSGKGRARPPDAPGKPGKDGQSLQGPLATRERLSSPAAGVLSQSLSQAQPALPGHIQLSPALSQGSSRIRLYYGSDKSWKLARERKARERSF